MVHNAGTHTMLTKGEALSHGSMVATKDKLATQAGLEILEFGGNAMDAAVAACFAIGVVEPASSGIGGGGYLVYQINGNGGVIGFPMRAPLAARPDMYQLTGEPAVGHFGWPGVVNDENLEGYRSIATPGTVSGLWEAHRRYGLLPWKEVLGPAVNLAREGSAPGWFNIYALGLQAGKLSRHPELNRIFLPDGDMPLGYLANQPKLRQTDLANTLDTIGRHGPDALYRGTIGEAIVSDIEQNGGLLTTEDLDRYQPLVWENGLEFSYRGFTVRTPPYASAGITSAMTLKLLDGFDIASMGHNSVDMLHTYINCARLAYADRFQYLADPEFAEVPWNGLISENYTQRRRKLVQDNTPRAFEPGDPWLEENRRPDRVLGASRPALDDGTTHLCVTDKKGNAVSLTNTLMAGFGSGIVPKNTGVIMNNGMMWFDPVPGRINSIEPGKAGLNNMTPALILDKNGVQMAVGASGGRRITNCVTQLIVKVLDFGMGPQKAIDSPRVDCSMPMTNVDPRLEQAVCKALEDKGHNLEIIGDEMAPTGFAPFASPVAIIKGHQGELRAGVDTFHSAYAEGR